MTLQDDMTADLSVFFDGEWFAVTATVKGSDIAGIFDHEYVEVLDIAGERPVLVCRSADVAAVVQGDAVTVNGTAYTVKAKRYDGTGITTLVLEEA